MKSRFLFTAAGLAALLPALATANVIIQFGGNIDNITGPSPNWESQIGASQIIHWNGVNSEGGSFGASGTIANQGVGATLTSLGTENLVLTTTGISATDPAAGFPLTSSAGKPNVLGITTTGASGDPAMFNVGNNEVWTFRFNQDVVLNYMVGAGMDFDGERFGLDLGANGTYEYQWNRLGFTEGAGTVAAVTYDPVLHRYVGSFTGGIAIPANTDVSITSLQGTIGLQALVVTVIPEPSTYALLFGIGAFGFIIFRRVRKNSR